MTEANCVTGEFFHYRANQLTKVLQGDDTYEFEYNGLGDRLQHR
jgi:YD repeat-containing protein